jgi:hypothetical protein
MDVIVASHSCAPRLPGAASGHDRHVGRQIDFLVGTASALAAA